MMLKEFMQSGRINSLCLGTSKAEVLHLLGEPDAKGGRLGRTEIWKYGSLQVGFNRGNVCFIGLYFNHEIIELPQPLFAEWHAHLKERQLESVTKFLLANEIEFEMDERLTFDDQVCLRVTKSGVAIYFAHNDLDSIQIGEPETKKAS